MKIAIYDSGMGGVTVLHEAIKLMPNEEYIYYSDCKNAPYGTKDRETVMNLISQSVSFISTKNIKALVVACNTATSVAINCLRSKYNFPILGMEPAVKPAVERSDTRKILVIATELTLREEKFKNLIAKVGNEDLIDPLPAPGLVDFAEKFIFDSSTVETYLNDILHGRDICEYGTVVLGCTHFPFFKKVISKIFGSNVLIIDGGQGTVRHLYNTLKNNGILATSSKLKISFYNSGELVEDVDRYYEYLNVMSRQEDMINFSR